MDHTFHTVFVWEFLVVGICLLRSSGLSSFSKCVCQHVDLLNFWACSAFWSHNSLISSSQKAKRKKCRGKNKHWPFKFRWQVSICLHLCHQKQQLPIKNPSIRRTRPFKGSIWCQQAAPENTGTVTNSGLGVGRQADAEPQGLKLTRTGLPPRLPRHRKRPAFKLQESQRVSRVSARGKFWKRWENQTTWPASWETCM